MIDEEIFAYDPRLQRVRDYVLQHLSESLPLETVAAVAGLERKYFSAFFHKRVGMTFREWITRLRVQRATEMFGSANHPVTRVAFSVGFQSVRTFERAFKRHASMTPRAYKKRVRPGPFAWAPAGDRP